MKSLSDFTNREVLDLLVVLNVELKTIMAVPEIKELFNAITDSTRDQAINIFFENLPNVINSLLVTNEHALWRILGAITQTTPEAVQDMNNVETVGVLKNFLSIERYRTLFTRAIKSDTAAAATTLRE